MNGAAFTTLEDAVIDAVIDTEDTLHNVLVRMAREHTGSLLELGKAIRDEHGDEIAGLLSSRVTWSVIARYYREEAEEY
jgi:hypothetical protein